MKALERHKFYFFATIAITVILGAILILEYKKSRLVLQSSSPSKVTPDTLLKAAHDLEKAGTIENSEIS